MQWLELLQLGLAAEVPILIQPEDWMQLKTMIARNNMYVSSNPHPARRLDAITMPHTFRDKDVVPILIQPEDWMQ